MSTPPLPRPPEEASRGEEPERLRASAEFVLSAKGRVTDRMSRQSAEDVLWLLAEVERLARDNAAIRTCYYPAPQYVKIEMERDRLRGEVERLAGERAQEVIDRDRILSVLRKEEAWRIELQAERERLAGRVAALTAALESISRLDQSSDEGYKRLYRQAQSTAVSALVAPVTDREPLDTDSPCPSCDLGLPVDCTCVDCQCDYELVEDGAVQRRRWFHEPGCVFSDGRIPAEVARLDDALTDGDFE